MELLTSRLRIREFRMDDFDAIYDFDSDPRVCRYETEELTAEQVRYRLEGALEWAQESPRTIYKLGITIPPGDRILGRLSLKATQNAVREWEIGWTLHPDIWGKGYTAEGAYAMLKYAFTRLEAHRVVAFSHAENTASIRVMEKIGMQREGCHRETILLNEVWYDEVIYGILEREFKVLQP